MARDVLDTVTDEITDNLAEYSNQKKTAIDKLTASTPYAGYATIASMSGHITLTDASDTYQSLDTSGLARDITLPVVAITNHPFYFVNRGAEVLTVKNTAAATIVVIQAGGNCLVLCDGINGWVRFKGIDYVSPSTAGNVLTSNGSVWESQISAAGSMLSTLPNAEISITGAATATISRMHVVSGSSNYTVTLPAASGNAGKFVGLRFTNTGVSTLDGDASETIDGSTTRPYYVGQTVVLMSDGSNWNTINGVTASRTVEIFMDAFTCSEATSVTVTSSQKYNMAVFQTSGANGASFTGSIFLNKGVYTASILGVSNNIQGKTDWTLNGVAQAGSPSGQAQDWYAASAVYNVEKTFQLTAPYTGYHVIKVTVNGKNASSSNYYVLLTKLTIIPSVY